MTQKQNHANTFPAATTGPAAPPSLDEVAAAVAPTGAAVDRRPLAELTTLRIGGQPAAVVECATAEQLAGVLETVDAAGWRVLIVGGGSNLLIGDGPEVSELVVVHAADTPAAGISIDPETGVCSAFAGVEWDRFVAATVAAGLGGLECLSGIPGCVGATPVQNVGAYGAEVSQVLRRVRLYDRARRVAEWVAPESLDLAYRYSNLKFTDRAAVLEVEFQLDPAGLSLPLRFGELARRLGVARPAEGEQAGEIRRPAAEVREAVLELRAGKGMVLNAEDHDTWSAGSFFTNPVVAGEAARDAVVAAVRERVGESEAEAMPLFSVGTPENPEFKFSAAWLIERAGFHKGWQVPGRERAGLSTKHTLALTNRGGASSEDLVALATAVRDGVFEAFGVELVPEPVWIGAELPPVNRATD
ncbi:UDP-N-acetylmuramate dehydrogenase [Corynebacterium urealyticum]|uniref:UDP-N-acetylenolpyruvoylglucosamine reductase n=1 Tax=Corynebacterium urealyticum TaxID=43771 RepID=A0A5D4FTJ2_9CORY|nr:UDP-N-acetylmuramate dehydrogenase [Corynebacterium urealyticum]TYR19866.1 UDP-N-acetylmuramate dehydrogenase [Corynebacterium urealyticum]